MNDTVILTLLLLGFTITLTGICIQLFSGRNSPDDIDDPVDETVTRFEGDIREK